MYAELHAHSSFSFMEGASTPADMVTAAWDSGLYALALMERDGLYSVVQVADTVAFLTSDMQAGLRPPRPPLKTLFGAELTLSAGHRRDDPEAEIVPLLARNAEGYRQLSRLIGEAHLRAGEKDCVHYDESDIQRLVQSGQCWVLTGGPQSSLRRTLESAGITAADALLQQLTTRYGEENIVLELVFSGARGECARNDALVELAHRYQPPLCTIATAQPVIASPDKGRSAAIVHALAQHRTVMEDAGWAHPYGGSFVRTPAEMLSLVGPHHEAVRNSQRLADIGAFGVQLLAPDLPPHPVPAGSSEAQYLRELTYQHARQRYGSPEEAPEAYAQIDRELKVIEQLHFPGYFLIVKELVDFCRTHGILCQGRGSAANSAVCFALGITAVDPIRNKLLFERFLSPEREGPPDIDLDIESQRREEVIQYVFDKYGRTNAAQVANVITYRRRSAIREVSRALGYTPAAAKFTRDKDAIPIPSPLVEEQASALLHTPQHMGIHSGGMVLCDRPVIEVVPVEWGRTPGRSIVQWDKDDCATAGLVKFDLLGLGMLTALHHCLDLYHEATGESLELCDIPLDDPEVYEMLQNADTVGVFQVESRAQMNCLPRLRPSTFFDLVVEVALVRPGPIQGNSVHPYIRRRRGEEAVTYDHPALQESLEKTLGIPLFQEQLMEIAQAMAGFTGGEADQLRRAIGSKRSREKMARLRARFFHGMREVHGIGAAPEERPGPSAHPDWEVLPVEIGERIWQKMQAFSSYGFPESHAQSFASLVFYSAWFKCHYPAIFCAALLRSQPMGFYSPQSLIADARRHGVVLHWPHVQRSEVSTTCCQRGTEVILGLDQVRKLGVTAAGRIVQARHDEGMFSSLSDVVVRARLTVSQVESLAWAGAVTGVGTPSSAEQGQEYAPGHEQEQRRADVWRAGVAATACSAHLPGITVVDVPTLPGMSAWELALADHMSTGSGEVPTVFVRQQLDKQKVVTASALRSIPTGQRVRVAGVITHRQRPPSAGGVTFLGMEDETGLMNIICSAGLWKRYRHIVANASAVIIRGIVDNASGAVSIIADGVDALELGIDIQGRDFR